MFKKNIRNNAVFCFVCTLLILFSLSLGCTGSISTPSTDSFSSPAESTDGYLIIEQGAEITKDCTPPLTIYSEGAVYMSFSGDSVNWCEWEEYSTSYEEFNIACFNRIVADQVFKITCDLLFIKPYFNSFELK